jgi:peptidoglycan/LPS O-acetylase OafA/YrhL
MISQKFSAELNCFRWVAALLVVISHIRNLLFVNYGDLEQTSALIKLFYFVTGFGHEAVIIFFVISGLLVGGTSLHKQFGGRFDATDFMIHRFSRIYIVFIPALLAGHLLDNAGLAYFNDSGLYTHTTQYNFNRIFASVSSWDILLANMLMLQHVTVPALGTNGPLWSLAYEWWYYCAFFCAVGAISAANGRRTRAAYACLLLMMGLLLPAKIVLWFLIWLLGMSIGISPLRHVRINAWFAYAVFFGILAWSRVDHATTTAHGMHVTFFRDFAVAVGCFVLFTALMQRSSEILRPGWMARLHRMLAEFSYTTYLVHFPFMVFAVACINSLFGMPFDQQPTAGGFLYFIALLLLIYLYSYLFSRLTEAHTHRLRNWLRLQTAKIMAPAA